MSPTWTDGLQLVVSPGSIVTSPLKLSIFRHFHPGTPYTGLQYVSSVQRNKKRHAPGHRHTGLGTPTRAKARNSSTSTCVRKERWNYCYNGRELLAYGFHSTACGHSLHDGASKKSTPKPRQHRHALGCDRRQGTDCEVASVPVSLTQSGPLSANGSTSGQACRTTKNMQFS